jgi:hypothetical protein
MDEPASVHILKSEMATSVQGTPAGQITLMGARDTPLAAVPVQPMKFVSVYSTPSPVASVMEVQ